MLTHTILSGQDWTLRFALEEDDLTEGAGQSGTPVGFMQQRISVKLPVVPHVTAHPDAEALAVFVIVRPWIGRRLAVRRAVSQEFASLVFKIFNIAIEPVDPRLKPRQPGSTPLLSYSAGFDSTAASVLFPAAPHLHHRRVSHPDVEDNGNYRADAIERLAVEAGKHGRQVLVTRTDFENIVTPHAQLPHWFGFAVGPLLLADHFDGGALILGGTLETWYMDMGRRWTGTPRKGTGIDPLPEAVGLPIMRPLVGVTEIGTMKLTLESPLANLARSCMSGTLDEACHRCSKCIRKDLIRGVLEHGASAMEFVPADAVGWNQFAGEPPYYMQAQFDWVSGRIPEENWQRPFAEAVNRFGRVPSAETVWMDRAYEPAIEYGVPPAWQAETRAQLEGSLGWMSGTDVATMEAWDRTSRT